MHAPENAFDRVKSLLGKLDRSIEDARRRRLTGDEERAQPEAAPLEAPTKTDHAPRAIPAHPGHNGDSHPEPPARPNSKYGRARPIRDLAGPSGPAQASWQRI